MKNSTKRTEASSYHRYLKPGALAQLRDSKISARSHRTSTSLSQVVLAGQFRAPVLPRISAAALDRVPHFTSYSFGPRYLNRKKLLASRSVNLPIVEPTSPESLMNLVGGDAVAAH